MSTARSPDSLTVWADGAVMGTLRRAASELEFEYSDEWLANEAAFPLSLALPLEEGRFRGAVVHNVLDNLLPDAPDVRRTIARNVGANGADVYSLLAAIGRDCVGAVQFLPEDEVGWQGGAPEGQRLTDEDIARMLASLGTRPLGVTHQQGFRISVAGAQAKTTLLRAEDAWWLPEGPTPSTHILKPAIGVTGGMDLTSSVENEFVCLQLCRELGLEVANASIWRFDGMTTLVVERFDRTRTEKGLRRVPQEDTCQAFGVPSSMKYEADGGPGMAQLLTLLLDSDEPLRDRERFFRAVFAYWLLGATDGHAKNFSLFLGPYPGFALAPLYDVMSLEPYFRAGQVGRRDYTFAMAIGKGRHYRVHDIVPRHFAHTAREARVDESLAWEWMADLARRASPAVEAVASAGHGPEVEDVLDPIAAGLMERVKLVELG